MEDFLLQLEMNYSISLINERSYDFFVHPVPNNEKVQSLLLKFGLENKIKDILFIVHNLFFTRHSIYIWKGERKLIIDYSDLYSMEIINSILYLNEMDVSSGKKIPVFSSPLGEHATLVEIMRNRKENERYYAREIILLFKESLSDILQTNKENKINESFRSHNNGLFGFISKESKDFEKLFIEKANKYKTSFLKDSSRLSIKPFLKSDFIKDIQDCFELDESQVLLCYDDSFWKSSHIALLITKENLYLRKDASTFQRVQIPLNLIQDIECKGLLIKKICVTTKDGSQFQQEFDNAEKDELKELPEYLKKILL